MMGGFTKDKVFACGPIQNFRTYLNIFVYKHIRIVDSDAFAPYLDERFDVAHAVEGSRHTTLIFLMLLC